MHAIIMAGGEGQRLRPLTCTLPKPLVTLLGRPAMAYAVQLAARHGVHTVHAAVSYQGEKIETTLGDGASCGVKLQYHREERPLGTAGSVREAAKEIQETFFVLSGDAITDCDLTQALAFHRRKGAMATLVLKQCAKTEAFGVVVTDGGGRVERFVEKPDAAECVSSWVNTGIYILEPEALRFIPQGRAYDFGSELFPRLIAQGLPVYGWPMQGYWRDIGDVEDYVGACADALDGRIGLDAAWETDEAGNRIAPDARVSEFAKVIAPCYIGADAQVAPGAVIGPHAVIEAHARVQRDARVKRSIVMAEATVGAGAVISGAVIAQGARVETGCEIWEGCVLGAQAVMEAQSALSRGARVWPQKRIEAGRHVTQDVVWGDCLRIRLREGRLEYTGLEEALQGACAWARVSGAKSAALMHDGSNRGKTLMRGAAAQLSAGGVNCFDLGGGSEPMLRMQARLVHTQIAIFFKKQQMIFLDAQQCPPTRVQQRTMELGHGALCPVQTPSQVKRIRGARAYYLAQLCRAADEQALTAMQPYGVIACAKKAQVKTVQALLERLGLENMRVCRGRQAAVRSYETGFFLSGDGKQVRVADSRGIFSAPQTYLLGVLALMERGEKEILLSPTSPPAAQALCRAGRVGCRRAAGDRSEWERALATYPIQQDFYADGLYALVCLLSCFVRARTIPRAMLEKHVQAAFCEQEIPCAHAYASRVLSALSREWNTPWTRGALQTFSGGGNAMLCADGNGGSIRIVTQSRDTETARELCGGIASQVWRKMKEMGCAAEREKMAEKDENKP